MKIDVNNLKRLINMMYIIREDYIDYGMEKNVNALDEVINILGLLLKGMM